ncbi:asparagine synthase C-terminal domain-containing protein [Pendulispora brunnea]|uniref:Asparagine synthase C-terminal domain-containing protein n=1 Tax=Pendulispora brunnea TaxID=2905690 RepID=A0ABZ2KK88_9BACT
MPTFYATEDGRVLASRSLAALAGSLRRRPRLNADRLAAIISLASAEDASLTVYEGIRRVPSHHAVRVWPDGRRTSVLLARALEPAPEMTGEDAASELRRRLTAVVARRAEGKRCIAIFAGGGVDSSTLLATSLAWSRGANGAEIKAIALDFAGPGDDRPYMRDLERALGIVPIRVSPSQAGRFMRPMMALDGAPCPWPNVCDQGLMLDAAAAQGADVVWSGAGGDDLYDGRLGTFPQRVLRGDAVRALREAASVRVPWRDPGWTQAWEFVVRPLLVRSLPHAVRRLRRRFRARTTVAWAGPVLREHLDRVTDRPALAEPTTPSARYTRFVTLPHLMEFFDFRGQLREALGIEHLDPLIDDEMIAFIASLPPELLFYGGRTRGLMRAAMEGIVPDSVRLRTDKARFEPAMTQAVRAAGGFEAFADLAAVPHLAELGLVEPSAFRQAFDALAREPEDWGPGWLEVWPALAVEAFVAGHRVGDLR